MATRTPYPGTESVGDVLTKANFDTLPGGTIGYVKMTSTQGSITASTNITSLVLVITPTTTARIIKISWQFNWSDTVALGTTEVFAATLMKDASQVAATVHHAGPAATNVVSASGSFWDIAPTVAAHTYQMKFGQTGSASGTATIQGSATNPAWIIATDEGVSF